MLVLIVDAVLIYLAYRRCMQAKPKHYYFVKTASSKGFGETDERPVDGSEYFPVLRFERKGKVLGLFEDIIPTVSVVLVGVNIILWFVFFGWNLELFLLFVAVVLCVVSFAIKEMVADTIKEAKKSYGAAPIFSSDWSISGLLTAFWKELSN